MQDSREEKNTALAAALALLAGFHLTGRVWLVGAALAVLVVALVVPAMLRPVSRLRVLVAEVVGATVAGAFLIVVFFVLVVPVGAVRRLLGKDPLRIASWRSGSGSLFTDRNHEFSPADLERPY